MLTESSNIIFCVTHYLIAFIWNIHNRQIQRNQVNQWFSRSRRRGEMTCFTCTSTPLFFYFIALFSNKSEISCFICKYFNIYISKLESLKNKCKILFCLKIIALIHEYHKLFMSVLISLIFPYLICS